MRASGARARLERIFRAGVAAADPSAALRREISCGADRGLALVGEPIAGDAPLHVLAMGKAAAAMARVVEDVAGDRVAAGLVITKPGHGVPLRRFLLREAGHPVPDARSAEAGREVLAFVARVPRHAVLLVLLSGGASSLTSCPAEGVSLEALAAATDALLGSGAPIDELNAVRKHLTVATGGRLALASRAERIRVLVVSDVAGDRLDVIGSGPFAPDPSRYADALAILDARCGARALPPGVRAHLEAGHRGAHPETPKPGAPAFARVRHVVLASSATAVEGARAAAQREGLAPLCLTNELVGEARVAGVRLAALGLAVRSGRPTCLVGGGETTVTLRGSGRGGRCQELCLAAACVLAPDPHVALLAGGTDGSDGPTDAAGAFADGGTLQRAERLGLDARASLAANDAYTFFDREGGLLRTGPTGTNVRDLVLVCARARSR